jgi:hypothetical protein
MSYRITRGDWMITKNVLTQLALDVYKKLEKERPSFEYETDCPSYNLYQAIVDSLVYVEERKDKATLTK